MKVLKNNFGSGYITPCIITLVIAMIFSAVLFYANCMTIIQTTRANTQRVLDSFVMKNSIEIYESIKQGHDFTKEFDENLFVLETNSELSLDLSSGYMYNRGDEGEVVYKITRPTVTYKVDKALKLKADYVLMLPVMFAGERLFDLNIPLSVTSNFTLKE